MASLKQDFLDLSSRGRGRVLLITALGTIGVVAVAVLVVSYTTQFMTEGPRLLTFQAAWGLSFLMAIPTFYIFANALRKAAIAQHELAMVASQDSLTTCLNRGAFVTLVDAYLSQVNAQQPVTGALLMVDADRFKSINDRFGHPAGDHALQMIATTIKSCVRSVDLVGRVGGEEFGVFLPRAEQRHANSIAERIRTEVQKIAFMPRGRPEQLSVSIGGAFFEERVSFEVLFAAADTQLYDAKRRGRNRVQMETLRAA
jgi:diguanylate cyclase (GGDEF)-like protein